MSKQRYGWWGYVKDMIRRYYIGEALPNEKAAVQEAVDVTERMQNGKFRLKTVELVLWKRTHTLEGAALQALCSERTVRRWQRDFVLEVAKNFKCDGLIS